MPDIYLRVSTLYYKMNPYDDKKYMRLLTKLRINTARSRNNLPCALLSILIALILSSPSVATTADNTKQVVFIRYNLREDTASAMVKEFKKTMSKRGYEEGIDIEYIDFITHSSERESAEEVIDAVEQYLPQTDMFITTGWTSLYVRSKLARSKVPQLFSPALQATALNMLPSVTVEPETNLSGVYLLYPPEMILRMTRHILPEIRKYAFVYDSRIPADVVLKSAYGQLVEYQRQGITIYYLDLATGTDTVLQKMNKIGIEAYGGAVGLLKRLSILSQNKLPIVTSILFDRGMDELAESIEQSNIIAGLYNPFDHCGRMTAEMTADIFDKKMTIEKTIPQSARQFAVVNLRSANRLKVPVPFSALEAADIVIK